MAKVDGLKDQREIIALRRIRDAIKDMRHGTITVFVQDGLVIQIDRTEKMRLDYTREGTHQDGEGI
jgi:hypothetical protein